ncbi:hypothetical protein D3OALGA1CA_4971 [Olavius algarvensis associated proteobacterium Delta 3]|nr:hypothetical protein D3OALGA1CA_4971 [Olavius algarvensis associated proteobacterium Delta 3]
MTEQPIYASSVLFMGSKTIEKITQMGKVLIQLLRPSYDTRSER